jgi:hypothetical protein
VSDCLTCGKPGYQGSWLEPLMCSGCDQEPDRCPCPPKRGYPIGNPLHYDDDEVAESTGARPLRETSLAALVRDGVPPPTLICGDLLYAGGLHSISGPPDAGKTTVSLWWLLQHVRGGNDVMFLDEEGGAELVAEKLIALDATPEEAARIRYYPFPARTWGSYDVILLREAVTETRPGLILWDSSAAFLARAGLDENAAADVTRFWSQVLTPLAREHRATVLVVDHDPKDGAASRYSRGSGAKLAACDAQFKADMVQPFSRTQNGVLRLTVTKDRRGWLHRWWEIGIETGGGGIKVRFTETTEDGTMVGAASPGLTPAETKVRAALDTEPVTIAGLTDRIAAIYGHGLTRETVSKALNKLARLGLAERYSLGAGKSALWAITAGQPVTITPPSKRPENL